MKRTNLILDIWRIAEEIASHNTSFSSMGHFYSKLRSVKSPDHFVDEAVNELDISESAKRKIQTKHIGVLDVYEFEEVMAVFQMLKGWRDGGAIHPPCDSDSSASDDEL